MQDLLDLVLHQDIASLPKELLQDIATDLNIPSNSSRKELARFIWDRIGMDQQQRVASLRSIRQRVFAGRTSITWYKLGEGQSLAGAKNALIENLGFNVFENMRIPPTESLTNNPVLIGGAVGDTEQEYYLRFMYKSGVTELFHGTQSNIFPTSSVKSVYVNEQHNCIEIRTDAKAANKFAKSLAQLLRQEISITQTDILAPYGHNIEQIADALNGELIDATAKPELLLESLSREQAEVIINILSALDEYFQEGDIDKLSDDLQIARETFGNDLVSIPFTALVLSGLEKIGMGGTAQDLRHCSPLYNLFRPHVQNQGGFIRFKINEDGIDNEYTVRVGLNTKSVYFMTQATETAIKYVREKIIY